MKRRPKDNKLMAITPAMREGSGMVEFSKKFPDRYFDVAIAEQHAVTFAAGLAIGDYKPVVAIYSTFLQRAYDQVIHDVAIQKLPGAICYRPRRDRRRRRPDASGSVPSASFLRCIPDMVVMTPSDENEYRQMLYTGNTTTATAPARCAIRAVAAPARRSSRWHRCRYGEGVVKRQGEKIAILNFGTLLPEAAAVADKLNASLVDMRFVKPLDTALILQLAGRHDALVTLEENAIMGGAGGGVNEVLMAHRRAVPVLNIGLPDYFIPQGTREEIRADLGLDARRY
ncbi:hypothetical protein MJ588_06715 [Klebsiella pneumoniae]|nr:hypothetical protein MJ588_06715 [Klebsiella pneumoniae]